jgi:hypothetical protein
MLLSSIGSLSRYFPSLSVLVAGLLCPSIPIQDTCQTRSSQHICGRALQLPKFVPCFYDPSLSIVAATFHPTPAFRATSASLFSPKASLQPAPPSPSVISPHQLCPLSHALSPMMLGDRPASRILWKVQRRVHAFRLRSWVAISRIGRHPRRLGCRVRVIRSVRSISRVIVRCSRKIFRNLLTSVNVHLKRPAPL